MLMSYITGSNELDAVYSAVTKSQSRSIAITSAYSQEGVTTLVLALARRILLAGHSVLIVDFNTYRPAFHNMMALPTVKDNLLTPSLITDQSQTLAITGVCIPESKSLRYKIKRADVLQETLEVWLGEYDFVLFDTTPVKHVNQQNISCLNVANVCDATIIVVLSGQTSQNAVAELKKLLLNAGAKILGCVLNDKNYPTLKEEILRELGRIPNVCTWVKHGLTKIVKNNNFLKMDL